MNKNLEASDFSIEKKQPNCPQSFGERLRVGF